MLVDAAAMGGEPVEAGSAATTGSDACGEVAGLRDVGAACARSRSARFLERLGTTTSAWWPVYLPYATNAAQ